MTTISLPRHMEFGPGCLQQLGKLASSQGATHVFVVIDAFLISESLRYDQKIQQILLQENIKMTTFSDYRGEPTTDHLKAALATLSTTDANCVVAVGGGSAIDLAKAVAVFGKNSTVKWEDIPNLGKVDRLPLIAVPTTAGTGSEATKVMVITNSETSVKMNPGHHDLIPDVCILDAQLTESLPPSFTAYTGLDALTHAMEAFVSNRSSSVSDHFARTAITMVGKALSSVYHDGKNINSRQEMLTASCYAGIAFSNASTNLAHAAGRPLGARFHIPHGLSVALLLPFVMRFGLDVAENQYAEVAVCLGEDRTQSTSYLANRAVEIVEEYNNEFQIWKDALTFVNSDELEKSIPVLVEDALSGNGILTNPRVPTKEDVTHVYKLLVEKLRTAELVRTS
ncbi:iron-containing alcohol dehydrogenase [Bacillus sp. AK128]